MVPRRGTRLVQVVVVSLAPYVIGMFALYQILYGIEIEPTGGWSDSTERAFQAVAAGFTFATLAVSIILARRFGAPLFAAVVSTASGIAMVWLIILMQPR